MRMWNPYVPAKPTGLLRGHNAPIFYVFIAEEEDRIFSLSTDKLLKVKGFTLSQGHHYLLAVGHGCVVFRVLHSHSRGVQSSILFTPCCLSSFSCILEYE